MATDPVRTVLAYCHVNEEQYLVPQVTFIHSFCEEDFIGKLLILCMMIILDRDRNKTWNLYFIFLIKIMIQIKDIQVCKPTLINLKPIHYKRQHILSNKIFNFVIIK